MADELTGQPAQAATPAEPTSTVPAAQPAPEPQPPTPSAPVGGGPSLESVLAELNAAKERAARAEHEALYTRNLIEQLNQGKREPAPTVPAEPPVTDDEFLTNPAKATAKIVAFYQEREKAEREQEKRSQYVERARELFETGRKTVVTPTNKLVHGIEDAIAAEIQNGIINGVIDPTAATDPDLWNVTALAYRYKALGERNFDKYLGSTTQGMAAGHQETPTPGAPPKAAPVLTSEERAGARFFGVTDEQWTATKKAEGK